MNKVVNFLSDLAKKHKITKSGVLAVLAATMGVASVLMNVFAGFRPFYTEGSHGVWRAVSFSTIAVSWIPFLVGNILADRYSKRVAFGIPAFIFALQAFVWVIAILLGSTDEGWQNLWAGIAGNYAGLVVNLLVFLGLKKIIGTNSMLTFAVVAIVSTVFGQLADNSFYMALSPFQWAGNVLEGGNFLGAATQWESINRMSADSVGYAAHVASVYGPGESIDWGYWGKVTILGWDSMFLKSAFEIGVEVVVYPLTFVLTSVIAQLPDPKIE